LVDPDHRHKKAGLPRLFCVYGLGAQWLSPLRFLSSLISVIGIAYMPNEKRQFYPVKITPYTQVTLSTP
jgi:hypothetical protein